MDTLTVDVLVVGGGPAGLATAKEAAAGGSVLVVHRDDEIGVPIRTSGGSWKRDILKLGIPSRCYQELSSLTFAGPTEQATVRFGADRPVVLDVTATYQYLATEAETAGVTIHRSTLFEGATQESDGSFSCVVVRDSIPTTVKARYLVDASGYCRAALTSLGLCGKPDRFGVGAEYECAANSSNKNHALLFVGQRYSPSGYGWAFPTNKGTMRIGIGILRPDTDAKPGRLLDRFLEENGASQLGLDLGEIVERHVGVIPASGPERRLVFGRVVAVGDSVGQALPNVGEGIRFCIDAGRHAGRAIAQSLDDARNEQKYLRGYERWWIKKEMRRFQLAQAVNIRLSSYSDDQWNRSVRRFALFSGDDMASFLRMEFSLLRTLRFCARNRAFLAQYIGRTIRRKYAA